MHSEKHKSLIANLLMFVMIFSVIFNANLIEGKAVTNRAVSIAEWCYTAAPTDADGKKSNVAYATGGDKKDGATLITCGDDIQESKFNNQVFDYSKNLLKTTNWNDGTGKKAWQINLSTKGYENLTISAQSRSSSSGPADFKLQYSTDGQSWTWIDNSEYSVKDQSAYYLKEKFPLPEGTKDAENLYIRFVMNSNKSVGGGKVSEGGASNLGNIVVMGTPIVNEKNVSPVASNIDTNKAIPLGQELTLTCATAGASIKYSLNGLDFNTYDENNKPKVTSLPATLVVYAEKEGLISSVKTTYNYTQAQVANVQASPNGGSVKIGQLVELSTATKGADISYSLDNGATWINYTEAFKVETLPLKVLVTAEMEGYISTNGSFNFSERENENYTPYFGQLHSHTNLSDGSGTIDEAYAHAQGVDDIDFLAVTDHSNAFDNDTSATITDGSMSTKWNTGREAADKYTKEDFIGIYGFEMTWSNGLGHINTYNTNGFQTRNGAEYKTKNALENYYKTLKSVPESISEFNHPGTTFGDFNDFANYDPEIDNLITLVEVGNGEGLIPKTNYFQSYEYYTRALDKGWHVAPTNNQDNHNGRWGDANHNRSVILADSLSRENIYDAIRNRRVYATEDQNLRINYTLNDEVMGTICNTKPNKVNIKVNAEDPDGENIGRVKVIVNGGKELAVKDLKSSKGEVTFDLSADYSYYYIRIEQEDGNIAVTAPVWIGEVDKAGISKTTIDNNLPVKGDKINITTELYDNEEYNMDVQSIKYSIDGKVINEASNLGTVESYETKNYSFEYTPEMSGSYNVDIELKATLNGVEKVYKDVLKLSVSDPAVVTNVLIDGTHYNDYVSGYYADNMANFSTIAANDNIKVNVETKEITREMLDDTNLLVITAPCKKDETVKNYAAGSKPQSFSDKFIDMVKDYVDKGGNLIVCGIADFQDGKEEYQSSTQLNKLLEKIGAKSRINNDEVVDDENHSGTSRYRLMFTNYNFDSKYLKDTVPEQKYSFYSGCSVKLDEESVAKGESEWLVKGHDTTYSFDSNKNVEGVNIPKGEVVALASEKLPGGGNMLIGGTVFISNFEVKATMDNASDLQYSNYSISKTYLNSIKREVKRTTIAEARKGNRGDVFRVEGIVTAGTETGNSFFDTIYIQDETGGMDIYPINEPGIKLGQKVSILGTLDEYLGDIELRVMEAKVIDESVNLITPELMSTKDAMNYELNGGKLVKVQGKVTKVHQENGVIDYFMLQDESKVEARIFIDGYIYGTNPDTNLERDVVEGQTISAIGLVSHDTDGVRMRVRDRSEIVKVQNNQSDGDITSGDNDPYNKDNNSGENDNSGINNIPDANNSPETENVNNLDSREENIERYTKDNVTTGDNNIGMILTIVLMLSALTTLVESKKRKI